jgi:pimeloyl-ACP methyl ester carboxylesterase
MDAPPVQFLTTRDGYNLAYCDIGEGKPFVFLPMTTTHLHVYWTQKTFVRPWWEGLAQRFRLIQYDGRGQGMSSRGLPDRFSSADLVTDLESLVDHLGIDRFVLMGLQWSGHTAVRYALDHAERVEALVLASCPTSFASWSLAMLQDLRFRTGRRTCGQWQASRNLRTYPPPSSVSSRRSVRAIGGS